MTTMMKFARNQGKSEVVRITKEQLLKRGAKVLYVDNKHDLILERYELDSDVYLFVSHDGEKG